ncbi:CDP-alcohol phosphatidyltransferase family protein [Haloglycomyces albus]|uniref:CDP-alcohol phosphatidyltransferase family protein n=1 Tax=Haloglycomyces albus TaxID=526067 RepID=UPI00046CE10B|nr:CDP-alcohol phosphatidyltransferase family protein [Haloglycomyces albus]
MTTAVVIDNDSPLFADGTPLRTRLEEQLTEAGVDRIVHSDGSWDELVSLAESGSGHMYFVDSHLVASQTTVNTVVADSSRRSGLLVGSDPTDGPTVVVDRGLIVQEGPSASFYAGLVKLSSAHRDAMHGHWGQPGEQRNTVLALTEALARQAIPVTAYRSAGLPYLLATDPQQAGSTREKADAVDLRQWRLRNAVKADDDIFATYTVSSWSPWLVKLAERLRLKPTTITWWSIAFAVAAAGIFAAGFSPWYIAGAGLMYFSFVFDCVDGQLARFTQQFSSFGGWLDMMADRTKEYVIYAGLAVGAAQSGESAWWIALLALVVQTVRHTADTWYAVQLDTAVAERARNFARGEGTRLSSGAGSALGAKLEAASNNVISAHRSFLYWVKRTIVAGVGDRWAVLAVVAVIWGPQIGLSVLLGWQLFALAYTSAGRLVRTLAARAAALDRSDRDTHRDDGLLLIIGGRLWPLGTVALGVIAAAIAVVLALVLPTQQQWITLAVGTVAVVIGLAGARAAHVQLFDWWIPAGLRALEFGVIAAAGIAADVPLWAIYTLIAVIALYFYDLAAGLDKAASPVDNRSLGLGWPVRAVAILAITAVALAFDAAGIATVVFVFLAVYMASVFIGAVLSGMRSANKAKEPELVV